MRKKDLSLKPVSSDADEPTAGQIRDAILHGTVFMAIAVDNRGTVTFFNAAAERALGYRADEVIGKKTPMIWHDAEEVRRHAAELSAEFGVTVEPGFDVFVKKAGLFGLEEKEWTFVRKDGSRFPVLLSVEALRDERGRVSGFLGIVEDVSKHKKNMAEREQLIEKLTESNAEFERFAYVASHDMQEPLRAMSSFSELIMSSYHDILDDEGRLYLKLICDAAARMQAMVVDLLEYARVGKETSRLEPFDAYEEYTHVMQNLATSIDGSDVHIVSEPLPQIRGNPVQFSRLLQNLIGNGLKYRRADVTPVVHIRAEDKGDMWLFSVADNGIGIAAKDQGKIFEPFKRLHTRQEYAGTGLGLSVCRKIVENHSGKIWCASPPDGGSIFYFTWPK